LNTRSRFWRKGSRPLCSRLVTSKFSYETRQNQVVASQ
jgi:hypothetical protein